MSTKKSNSAADAEENWESRKCFEKKKSFHRENLSTNMLGETVLTLKFTAFEIAKSNYAKLSSTKINLFCS